MGFPFPSEEWLKALVDLLNTDEKYAETARNWEGDLIFRLVPEEGSAEEDTILYYMDLWHGKCREAKRIESIDEKPDPKFVLELSSEQAIRIFEEALDPVQAMVTGKLKIHGSLGYMLRNVPVVLDFIRVCRRVEIED
jgi:putative sterol carrier protein